MLWKKIFNPFSLFSEKLLLLIGLVGFVLLNGVCYWFGQVMNGIFHIGYTNDKSFLDVLFQNSFICGSTILVLVALAYFYNNKSRIIDVANSVLLALIPNIMIVLIGSFPYFNHASEVLVSLGNNQNEIMQHKTELFTVLVISFCVIPFAIYSVILLYNGFKTATNMKSWQKISLFFILVFILNLITQITL